MEKHEDYCAGHLIEAGVAYYRTTGKRKLLDVAIRLADHIDATFRIPDRHWVSGHEEIELALVKLYHLTGNDRYLKLADWYLDQRGHGFGRGVIWTEAEKFGPAYCQDVVPVKQQKQDHRTCCAGHVPVHRCRRCRCNNSMTLPTWRRCRLSGRTSFIGTCI